MNKRKLFIENFLIYGFGGIISKVIPLIMIPIITRLMPNSSYYGINDLANTVISFAQAFAVMGMYDAMYRMFFEKDDIQYKKEICSTALFFTMVMSVAVFVLMLIMKNAILQYMFGDIRYKGLVYITAIATMIGATNSIVSAPTRMKNKRIQYIVMNLLSSIFAYSIAIPMLINGYYIFALPVATLISGVSCEIIFYFTNREWFQLSYFRLVHLRDLLRIGLPLLPNFLIYWVFNSCDKLMITHLIDTSATGIYAIGSKLGMASQLIYTAFVGGWQFFSFSTMKEENQVENNSKIFEYLGIISFICTVYVFAISHWIYQLLFTKEYVRGYIVAPYLFLAPLLQMLFQVACNQFLIIKKTWPNMFILSFSAVINLILNRILIPRIGIEGAAIATLCGYVIADILVVIVLSQMKLMVISKKFLYSCMLLIIYILIWRFLTLKYTLINVIFAILVCLFYIMIYKDSLKFMRKKG